MLPLSLHQALVLYGWFPLAALLFFVLLIARVYQKFSGQNTYFRLYLVPIVLFGAGAARAAGLEPQQADILADLLFAGGGLVLLALIALLYRRMMVSRVPLKQP